MSFRTLDKRQVLLEQKFQQLVMVLENVLRRQAAMEQRLAALEPAEEPAREAVPFDPALHFPTQDLPQAIPPQRPRLSPTEGYEIE